MPASTSPETEAYYLQQAALATWASTLLQPDAILEPAALEASFDVLVEQLAQLSIETTQASIGLAADYYETFRESRVTSAFRVPVIDGPTAGEVMQLGMSREAGLLGSIDSLVDELYLADVYTQIRADSEALLAEVTLDAGLEQLFAAIKADPATKAWVRVTREGACSFCRMLAMRGPVFDVETVKFRAHVVKNGRGGVCQCTAEPLMGESFEPTAQSRSDAALWARIADEGHAQGDALNEFRRHIEGRAGGERRRGGKGQGDREPRSKPQALGFNSLTPAQLRNHLATLGGMPDSDYKRGQLKRIHDRLAVLAPK